MKDIQSDRKYQGSDQRIAERLRYLQLDSESLARFFEQVDSAQWCETATGTSRISACSTAGSTTSGSAPWRRPRRAAWPMRGAGRSGADDEKRGSARLKPAPSGAMMKP